MNSFYGAILLIAANLILVASYENRTIFRKSDIIDQVVIPPLPSLNLTMPGTKWCGIGSTAASNDDLGQFNKTDTCCRVHQECEDVIAPIGSMHSLHNPSLLPRYNCGCEQKFLKCLKDVEDIPSTVIGQAYFSLMEKCFAKEYPVVECVKYQNSMMGKRCVLYRFDESQQRKYQYFDLPFYTKKEE